MNALTHYIVVRRDLPFGVICASLVHAAGESFYALCRRSSEKEHLVSNQEAAGSSPAVGPTFDPAQTVAVVLGARNEGRLRRLAQQLTVKAIPHVVVLETEGEFSGQVMAIGLVPGDKRELADCVREFHMFRELETPCATS